MHNKPFIELVPSLCELGHLRIYDCKHCPLAASQTLDEVELRVNAAAKVVAGPLQPIEPRNRGLGTTQAHQGNRLGKKEGEVGAIAKLAIA